MAVKVAMNSDATVRSAVIVGTGGNLSFTEIVADSAITCYQEDGSLDFALDSYDQWKVIIILDPQHIL